MTDTPTPAVPGAMAMTEERLADELERLAIVCEEMPIQKIHSTDPRLRPHQKLETTLRNNLPAIITALRECSRLRAQVREAEKVRAEALEEAAKVAEDFAQHHVVQWQSEKKRFADYEVENMLNAHMRGAVRLVASDIRALTPQPAPTEGGKG